MRKLLIILLLVFLSCSYIGGEEDKAKVVIMDPEDSTLIYDWPLWLFNHGYTSYYDSNWSTRRGSGAIVLRKPLSFGESFVKGFSEGISKGLDNYYRAKEQKQDIEFKMALIKLKWASEGKDYRPKSSRPYQHDYTIKPFVPDREPPAVWLEKQKKKEKEEDDFTKYMRSIGAMLPWEYKTKKLNEYLKSQGLSLVPENVDVNQVYDGEWIIYWDGEKWARKKKEMNDEKKEK